MFNVTASQATEKWLLQAYTHVHAHLACIQCTPTHDLVSLVLQRQQTVLEGLLDKRRGGVVLEVGDRELLELVFQDVFVIHVIRHGHFDVTDVTGPDRTALEGLEALCGVISLNS